MLHSGVSSTRGKTNTLPMKSVRSKHNRNKATNQENKGKGRGRQKRPKGRNRKSKHDYFEKTDLDSCIKIKYKTQNNKTEYRCENGEESTTESFTESKKMATERQNSNSTGNFPDIPTVQTGVQRGRIADKDKSFSSSGLKSTLKSSCKRITNFCHFVT